LTTKWGYVQHHKLKRRRRGKRAITAGHADVYPGEEGLKRDDGSTTVFSGGREGGTDSKQTRLFTTAAKPKPDRAFSKNRVSGFSPIEKQTMFHAITGKFLSCKSANNCPS
jgi:hypothetical protein